MMKLDKDLMFKRLEKADVDVKSMLINELNKYYYKKINGLQRMYSNGAISEKDYNKYLLTYFMAYCNDINNYNSDFSSDDLPF